MFKLAFRFTLLFWITSIISSSGYSIILGRPTNQSITVSVLMDSPISFYLKYGIQPGQYSDSTMVYGANPTAPNEVDLTGLVPDARYYYVLCYLPTGSTTYVQSPEYTFHTQRSPGSTFTFDIESDEHLYDKKGIPEMYRVTLANEAADQPDFLLSLGDIFGDDHDPDSMTAFVMDTLHRYYRQFLGPICHSIPFYVCLGNHEGENDYYLAQTPPNNIAIWGTMARQKYYPNPYPNGFYSGNTTNEPFGVGQPENYYAWTWGDALFVVLDVYRDQCDTSPKPGGWAWSLGRPQYDWLQSVLDSSTSTYKFVFAHHLSGQGRGAVALADKYEWGGYDNDGVTFSFPNKRPGWAMPIHDLFVQYGVNVFFQGHDHLFAHEVLDGVTYQEVPMPSDSTYKIGVLANADAYLSDTIDGTGHIRVTVDAQCITVDYVKAFLPRDTVNGQHQNGQVAFSYTLGPCASTQVEESNVTDGLRVYPNPANDKLYVLGDGIRKLQLYDATGALVASNESLAYLPVASLATGFYFLRVQSDQGEIVKKVIIQHP